MNASNIGTVKAVSPWFGLQVIPLAIKALRVGATDVTSASQRCAMSRVGRAAIAPVPRGVAGAIRPVRRVRAGAYRHHGRTGCD